MCNLSFLRSSQCAALLETKLINQPIKYFHYLSPQCGRLSVQNNGRGAAFKRCFSHLVDHPKCFTTQASISSVHSEAADTVYTNMPQVWAHFPARRHFNIPTPGDQTSDLLRA